MKKTLVILLALLCLGAYSQARASTRPNFILIIADDMAWDDCGAYGHRTIRTPNLDRLAQSGLRFDRAFVTSSSCSPSRASLITARYPHSADAGFQHGMDDSARRAAGAKHGHGVVSRLELRGRCTQMVHEPEAVGIAGVQTPAMEPKRVGGFDRARRRRRLVGNRIGRLLVRCRDVAANQALLGQSFEERRDIPGTDGLPSVAAGNTVLLQPIAMDHR